MSRKITCFIADDEPIAREGLAAYISRIDYLDLRGRFEDALQLDAALHSDSPDARPDLLFLDIEMPRLSGLDYLASLPDAPAVIITTAYDRYALRGFDLNVIDYLLKPIPFSRFMQAAAKARDYLMPRLAPSTPPRDFIFLRADKKLHQVRFADILWVEALENYVKVVTSGSGTIMARMTLKSIAALLPASDFLQLHKSLLVNMTRVTSIEGNMLRLADTTLTVSRHYRPALDAYLGDI